MTATLKASLEADGSFEGLDNHRLRNAVHRYTAVSRKGLEERLFTWAFSGLVYPQIWEDPAIDLEAMALRPGEKLVAIASGGCNLLAYLASSDVTVTGIDLNPAHVAFNKLKHAAVRHLADYETFAQLFAKGDSKENVRVYEDRLAPHLDAVTRAYWEGRDRLGRRRISYFSRGLYRQGLLGQFIAMGHLIARLHGRNPRKMLEADTREDQVHLFNKELLPLFSVPHLRWLMEKPASLFGLGIPPSQFEALKGREPTMAHVLKARLERLACGFDLKSNYFAWQAFGRSYGNGPMPDYLDRKNWETLKARIGQAEVVHASMTEHLAARPEKSLDAYVLLDAQDWMTDEQLTDLWAEILRTARPGARVIFRTAGEETILPGRVPDEILTRFRYDVETCRAWTERDRSSIYGGFHLYVLGA